MVSKKNSQLSNQNALIWIAIYVGRSKFCCLISDYSRLSPCGHHAITDSN